MIKLAYNVDNLMGIGFYKVGIHKNIPINHINIDKKLWLYLLSIGSFKIKSGTQLSKESLYTILDKDIFEEVIQKQPKPKPSPIECEVAQLMLELVNKDMQIKELETQQAQILLDNVSSDVEMKKLKKDMVSVLIKLTPQGGK